MAGFVTNSSGVDLPPLQFPSPCVLPDNGNTPPTPGYLFFRNTETFTFILAKGFISYTSVLSLLLVVFLYTSTRSLTS